MTSDTIKIGKYDCFIRKNSDGWYLTAETGNNQDVYTQFDIDLSDINNATNLGLITTSNTCFPWHKTRGDLEKTIKYLRSLEKFYEEWDRSNPNYKSLVGRKIRWNITSKTASIGDEDIIKADTGSAILILTQYDRLDRTRFRDGDITLLPVEKEIIYEPWDCRNPNYKSLIGRYIEWLVDSPIPSIKKGEILKIVEDSGTSSGLRCERYGELGRVRFSNLDVKLLPEDYSPNPKIVFREPLNPIGRRIKFLKDIHRYRSIAVTAGSYDIIMEDLGSCYELKEYGPCDKKRFIDGEICFVEESEFIELKNPDKKAGTPTLVPEHKKHYAGFSHNPYIMDEAGTYPNATRSIGSSIAAIDTVGSIGVDPRFFNSLSDPTPEMKIEIEKVRMYNLTSKPSRKKPSLLSPITIKKRRLI